MADSEPAPDVPTTLGALLVGGAIALVLSGVLSVQCIIFYKLYPNDARIRHIIVLAVWILDILHSTFVVTALFSYFIDFFGDRLRIDHIAWSIALTVIVTALQTLIAHWYYAHKIYTSSGKNLWITGPIVVLALGRLLAAAVSTYEMIHLAQFSAFTHHYPGWIFTTGLTLSASVDLIITGWLCYFLQSMRRRTSSTMMARVVRTMTFYTLENGLVTCVATTASLICWLTMPKNLIFLGVHFVIGKLYANSLLISLNTRKELREMRWTHDAQAQAQAWSGPVLSPVPAHSNPGSPMRVAGYATGYNTYIYGGESLTDGTGPTYHPAFKVAAPSLARTPVGIRVTKTVRHVVADDMSVSDVSQNERTSVYTFGTDTDADAELPKDTVVGRRYQFGAQVKTQTQKGQGRSGVVVRTRSRSEDSRASAGKRVLEDRWRALP